MATVRVARVLLGWVRRVTRVRAAASAPRADPVPGRRELPRCPRSAHRLHLQRAGGGARPQVRAEHTGRRAWSIAWDAPRRSRCTRTHLRAAGGSAPRPCPGLPPMCSTRLSRAGRTTSGRRLGRPSRALPAPPVTRTLVRGRCGRASLWSRRVRGGRPQAAARRAAAGQRDHHSDRYLPAGTTQAASSPSSPTTRATDRTPVSPRHELGNRVTGRFNRDAVAQVRSSGRRTPSAAREPGVNPAPAQGKAREARRVLSGPVTAAPSA